MNIACSTWGLQEPHDLILFLPLLVYLHSGMSRERSWAEYYSLSNVSFYAGDG